MKMTTGTGYGALTCEVAPSPMMSTRFAVPCVLAKDTVGYAACRFLRRSEKLSRGCVRQSYALRLASGRARRAVRRCIVAPAALLELPGAWAHLRVAITPAGVLVEHIGLYNDLREAQWAARNPRRGSP